MSALMKSRIMSLRTTLLLMILGTIMSCGENSFDPVIGDNSPSSTWSVFHIAEQRLWSSPRLADIWVSPGGDFVIAGGRRRLLQYDGNDWTEIRVKSIHHSFSPSATAVCGKAGVSNQARSEFNTVKIEAVSSDTSPGKYEVWIHDKAERAEVRTLIPQTGVLVIDEKLALNGETVNLRAGMSQRDVMNEINRYRANTGIQASIDPYENNLRLTTNNYGSMATISIISDVAASSVSSGFGTRALTGAGQDIAGTIGGFSATGEGKILTADRRTPVRGLSFSTLKGDYCGTITVTKSGYNLLAGGYRGEIRIVTGPGKIEIEQISNYAGSVSWSSIFDIAVINESEYVTVGEGGAINRIEIRPGSTFRYNDFHRLTEFNLNGVWSGSEECIYAVGDSGTVLMNDGTRWSSKVSGVENCLNAVWGSAEDDVYAVGTEGIIIHFDGIAWSPVETPVSETLWDIWGSSAIDIYAVGDGGTILRYDGNAWYVQESGTCEPLCGVHGDGNRLVYAVGEGGLILRGRIH